MSIEASLREIGVLVRERFLSGTGHSEKARLELVTETDLEVEARLRELVLRRFPSDTVIGEELPSVSGSSDTTWYLDPIDGTTNFIMGKPYFAISLASERNGRIMDAYVLNPVTDELYHADSETGCATLNGIRIQVSKTSQVEQALVAFGFSAKFERIKQYHKEWNHLWESCRKGVGWVAPALSLCNVARGRIDVFVDAGSSCFGHAGAALIVEMAGGIVSNYDLEQWDFRSRGVVATNGHLHNMLDSPKAPDTLPA